MASVEEKEREGLLYSLGDFQRQIAFYAKVLSDGRTLEHRADVSFFPVDFNELWLMCELHLQAEEGLVRFDHRYPMQSTPIGDGPLRSLRDQPVLSLLDYCRIMVIFGDGDATRMLQSVLWEAFSRANLEGLERKRSYSRCYSRARELGTIFEKLAQGFLISEQSSAGIREILREESLRRSEPLEDVLPPGVVSLHHAAANSEVRAEAGMVLSQRTILVFSVFSDGWELGGPPYELVKDLVRQILAWSRI